MTTTVQEIIANLKHYAGDTKVIITDVDDNEFALVDFKHENNTVNIVIGEIVIDEKQEE
ncbi:hypothetical protein [Nostoc sp. 2RC]|jgi:hypothetical protein|uniref:hypothetical protein n=1 Tax=Nostoc sp. 2RC TaxID=2485484 RepID=UPI00162853B3|nr:hypothetical protein [Nostoc sp. 2RC]MBC1241859.1 hypothetical protein [Nostoc sp. 2RC]